MTGSADAGRGSARIAGAAPPARAIRPRVEATLDGMTEQVYAEYVAGVGLVPGPWALARVEPAVKRNENTAKKASLTKYGRIICLAVGVTPDQGRASRPPKHTKTPGSVLARAEPGVYMNG